MTDYPLVPEQLSEDHLKFLIESFAINPNALLEIKDKFERFYKTPIKGETIQKIKEICSQQIINKRKQLYEEGINDIPLAHSYVTVSLAQSRIEDLLKNPKLIKQKKIAGSEDWEDVYEIDDFAIQKYLKIAQDERFFNQKMQIELIVREVDKQRLPKTGFKPIEINSGFEINEESKVDS